MTAITSRDIDHHPISGHDSIPPVSLFVNHHAPSLLSAAHSLRPQTPAQMQVESAKFPVYRPKSFRTIYAPTHAPQQVPVLDAGKDEGAVATGKEQLLAAREK